VSDLTFADGGGTGRGTLPRKPALVVSHERSGTHFLMNTLGQNFGYLPYTDLDERQGFDPRSTPQRLDFLLGAPWPTRTVLKSHHQVEMLQPLPLVAAAFEVFYIVRDPRDVLLSFRRYLAGCAAGTGPVTATVGEFLRAAPSGLIVRYQRQAAASMVERWRQHVEGWLDAAAKLPGRVTVLRYDDLDERFAVTVERLAAALGRPAAAPVPVRPSKIEHVVLAGEGGSGRYRGVLTADDLAFVAATAGDAMRRVGCPPD
jgi:hypothetical protein